MASYKLNKRINRDNKSHKIWSTGSLVIVSIIIVGLFWVVLLATKPGIKTKVKTQTKDVPVKDAKDITSLRGRYLFNGTTVWARQVEKDSVKDDGSYDYSHPFSQLNTLHRENYDAWSTDFECPITNNVVSFREQVDNLVFNCRPEFLKDASKYFNLYDLANNHTDNQNGMKGLTETRKHMDEVKGVQYFGSFDPSVANDVCEVVALPIRLEKSNTIEEKSAIPIAMCAWHYFYRKPLANEIEVMKRYADIMPVFAFVEMGVEYHPVADGIQQEIAHQVIDQGPEFLIANNPHWVQNTEVYKGKLIVYSLGNFIFDQLDTETQRGASIDLSTTINYDDNVGKWLKLAPSCVSFQDDCLNQAEKQGLKKIKLKLNYSVVASQGGARKLTRKADDVTQAAVEQRMNWKDTIKKLGQ